MSVSLKSLNIDSGHTVFASLPNLYTHGAFLYPFENFTFQCWIKTNSGGVIASNQYRPPAPSGRCADTSDYGYWSLALNHDGSLSFDLSYYKYMPHDPSGNPSPADFPFRAYDCHLKTKPSFSDGQSGTITLKDMQWHRIEAVRDGYILRLYVDGLLVNSKAFDNIFASNPLPFTVIENNGSVMAPAPALSPANTTSSAAPLYIGWDPHLSKGNRADNHFCGQIDEVRLWGTALSRTALDAWSHQTPPQGTENLLGRWSFDSDSQAKPLDATGRNQSCSWYGGTPDLSLSGYQPPAPHYLRLLGSGSQYRMHDKSAYHFAGDFSVQAWICPDPGQNGPIVSRQDDNMGGWTLLTESDGSLSFYLRSNSQSYHVTSPPAALFDGRWHHVTGVRQGNTLKLYVDGRPMGSKPYTSGIPAMSMNVESLYIGATGVNTGFTGKSKTYARTPTGGYDEVRLWSRALNQTEISAGMFHQPPIDDPNLVGYWPFDSDFADHSKTPSAAFSASGSSLEPAPFDFTPLGQPYLLVQSCLMQEYDESTNNVSDTSTYRVIVSARGPNDGGRVSKLTLWSDEPVTLRSVSGSAVTVSTMTPLDAVTDASGQYIFTIRAKLSDSGASSDDRLYCPGIYIRADFMSETEQIFVSPDRQFHAQLANVSGTNLKSGINGGPALLDGSFSSTDADAIAGAINDIMSTASHHGVRASSQAKLASYPVTSAAKARDVAALGAGTPTQPLYLSRKVSVLSANPATHVIRANYVPVPVSVDRTAVSGYRVQIATRFNYQSRSFTPASSDDMSARMAKCAVVDAPQMKTESGAQAKSSWWNKFVSGTLDVLDSFVETVHDAVDTLRVTVVHIADKVEQAFQYIIEKVEDAADYLKGMLASLGVKATKVIDFCRAMFSWDQYRATHGLMMTYIEQMYQALQSSLQGVNTLIDQKLMSMKSQVDSALETFLSNSALSDHTLQSAGGPALAQPASDVQGGYLPSVFAANIDNCTTAQPTGGTPPSADIDTPDLSKNTSFMNFMAMFVEGRGIFSLGLRELVQGLKSLVDWLFDTAKSAVDGVFSAVEGLLNSVWSILDGPLPHIPILTNLFERKLGLPWTPRSLFCMMGSVVANIAYKLAKKDPSASLGNQDMVTQATQERVFYNAAMRICAQLGIPVSGGSNSTRKVDWAELFTVASWGMGGVYVASTCIWGVASCANDERTFVDRATAAELRTGRPLPGVNSPLPRRSPLTSARMFGMIFANLSAFPLMVFNTAFSPRVYTELALWCVYMGSMLSDIITWARDVGTAASSIISGIFGGLALAAGIVLCVFDFIEEENTPTKTVDLLSKLTVNIMSSMTLLSQLGFLVPMTAPYGVAINQAPFLIDASCYLGGAGISFFRLIEDMSLNVPDIVR